MDLKLSSCTLPVHDLGEALAFYRDVLGFDVRGDVESGGMRRVSVGPPSQPEVQVILEPPAAAPWISPADKQAIADLMQGLAALLLNLPTRQVAGAWG